MHADTERWNRKYLEGDGIVVLKGEPELVKNSQALSSSGLAIELACGKGANALYLCSLGYDVVAADASIEGLKICLREANNLKFRLLPAVMDLDHYPLPANSFDLISVVRYLNRALFDDLVSALKPGGILFYKTFNPKHLESHPGFNPAFVVDYGELSKVFTELEIIDHDEQGSSSFVLGRKV